MDINSPGDNNRRFIVWSGTIKPSNLRGRNIQRKRNSFDAAAGYCTSTSEATYDGDVMDVTVESENGAVWKYTMTAHLAWTAEIRKAEANDPDTV